MDMNNEKILTTSLGRRNLRLESVSGNTSNAYLLPESSVDVDLDRFMNDPQFLSSCGGRLGICRLSHVLAVAPNLNIIESSVLIRLLWSRSGRSVKLIKGSVQ